MVFGYKLENSARNRFLSHPYSFIDWFAIHGPRETPVFVMIFFIFSVLSFLSKRKIQADFDDPVPAPERDTVITLCVWLAQADPDNHDYCQ